MRLERRLGYETEERRLHARACRLRPQRTSLVWSGQHWPFLSRRTVALSVRQSVLSGPDPFTQILTLRETLCREAVHSTAGLVLGSLRDLGTVVTIN